MLRLKTEIVLKPPNFEKITEFKDSTILVYILGGCALLEK